MKNPDFIILFVENPLGSAEFYRGLLGAEPVESSPTFALFVLSTGLKLGLWSRHTALPAVTAQSGSSEVCFLLENAAEVDRTYSDWTKRGLSVLQTPVEMDFGYTFVVTDPDGHRLRAYARTDTA